MALGEGQRKNGGGGGVWQKRVNVVLAEGQRRKGKQGEIKN